MEIGCLSYFLLKCNLFREYNLYYTDCFFWTCNGHAEITMLGVEPVTEQGQHRVLNQWSHQGIADKDSLKLLKICFVTY